MQSKRSHTHRLYQEFGYVYIEGQIAKEEMKKPLLTKERIMFWLLSFKSGDVNDVEYQRRVVDTLVNSIYVFDSEDGDGRKIVFTFNISGQNTSTIHVSDIACFAPPKYAQSNHFFVRKGVWGCVIDVKDVG